MDTGLLDVYMSTNNHNFDWLRPGGNVAQTPSLQLEGCHLRRGHLLGPEDQFGQLKADLRIVEDGGNLTYKIES